MSRRYYSDRYYSDDATPGRGGSATRIAPPVADTDDARFVDAAWQEHGGSLGEFADAIGSNAGWLTDVRSRGKKLDKYVRNEIRKWREKRAAGAL